MTVHGVIGASLSGRLRGVTLEVTGGEIAAVVGGDGAGKSTLLRLLAGSLAPDAGAVMTPRSPEGIGFVPTGAGFYGDLTVAENLHFVARAYGLDSERLAERSEYVLDLTGLSDFTERLARDLSGGMRQKLALALGTLHEPELLVLDEPTTGVDPVSRTDLWRIIAGAAASGVHVVVATSYIDEAERAATVLALHDGTALLQGAPDELTRSVPGRLVDVAHPQDRELAWRSGSRWRQWIPGDAQAAPPPGEPSTLTEVHPRLEDAVIVATLDRLRRRKAGDAESAA